MGGGNAQKAKMARERNLEKLKGAKGSQLEQTRRLCPSRRHRTLLKMRFLKCHSGLLDLQVCLSQYNFFWEINECDNCDTIEGTSASGNEYFHPSSEGWIADCLIDTEMLFSNEDISGPEGLIIKLTLRSFAIHLLNMIIMQSKNLMFILVEMLYLKHPGIAPMKREKCIGKTNGPIKKFCGCYMVRFFPQQS